MFEPMNPRDRRVVHLALAKFAGVIWAFIGSAVFFGCGGDGSSGTRKEPTDGGGAAGAGGTSGGAAGQGGAAGVSGVGGAAGVSGVGGAAGAPSTALCAPYCAKAAAESCSSYPEAECLDRCATDYAEYSPKCTSVLDALLVCGAGASGTFACTPSGYAWLDGCNEQLQAFATCSVCEAQANDQACEACQKATCCAELQAAYAHPDFVALIRCRNFCEDNPCKAGCDAQYGAATAAYQPVLDCQLQSCTSC